ncbi:MAG: 50S ribosomal protein L29 [Candidatus Aenigmatarchaeota archaeon]
MKKWRKAKLKRVEELRKMKDEDLDKRLSELRLELLKEQGNIKTGRPIKNPGRIKQIKKTIARILTIKRERKEGKGKNV